VKPKRDRAKHRESSEARAAPNNNRSYRARGRRGDDGFVRGQNRLGHSIEISRATQPGKRANAADDQLTGKGRPPFQCDGAANLLADAWASR